MNRGLNLETQHLPRFLTSAFEVSALVQPAYRQKIGTLSPTARPELRQLTRLLGHLIQAACG